MKFLLVAMLFLMFFVHANAQRTLPDSVEKEGVAVAEFGGAISKGLKGGNPAYGYNVAVETTPVENWLELELGLSTVFGNHSKETDIDFLFKKPWTLSPKA